MGNGQFLRLQLSGSLERLQVDLSFTEPRFLDRNLSAGFDLFHKEVDQTRASRASDSRTYGRQRAPRLPAVREPVDADRLHARRATRSSTWQSPAPSTGCGHRGRREGDVATGPRWSARRSPTTCATIRRTRPAASICSSATDFAGLGGDVQYSACQRRRPRLLSDHREDHASSAASSAAHIQGWGGDDVRLHRPVLQGRRDDPRLRPRRLRSARLEHRRRARRHDVLGDDGGSPLPAPVRAGRPRLSRRRLRRRRLAVGCRRSRAENAGGLRRLQRLESASPTARPIRSSVGASLMWTSPVGPHPHGLRQGSHQRDLRRRADLPLRRVDQVLIAGR